jgi:hypothetical protein
MKEELSEDDKLKILAMQKIKDLVLKARAWAKIKRLERLPKSEIKAHPICKN